MGTHTRPPPVPAATRQGSEFPVVVMPLATAFTATLQRNLLYTAVTRAGRQVVPVGQRRAPRWRSKRCRHPGGPGWRTGCARLWRRAAQVRGHRGWAAADRSRCCEQMEPLQPVRAGGQGVMETGVRGQAAVAARRAICDDRRANRGGNDGRADRSDRDRRQGGRRRSFHRPRTCAGRPAPPRDQGRMAGHHRQRADPAVPAGSAEWSMSKASTTSFTLDPGRTGSWSRSSTGG